MDEASWVTCIKMRIGFDLDNTIVFYDKIFTKIGKSIKNFPENLGYTKKSVADFLRNSGRESEWTKLQGLVYGPEMENAEPAPNFLNVIKKLHKLGHSCFIISHRTKKPSSGDNFDLHKAANDWIDRFCRPYFDKVYFEETIEDKITRIDDLFLDVFIDDLEKVLLKIKSPYCEKILFSSQFRSSNNFNSYDSWDKILSHINYVQSSKNF